jgi:hypothetical protein
MSWQYPAPQGYCHQCPTMPKLRQTGGEGEGYWKCGACDARYQPDAKTLVGEVIEEIKKEEPKGQHGGKRDLSPWSKIPVKQDPDITDPSNPGQHQKGTPSKPRVVICC